MSQFIKFYFTSSMLNMFRTLIHPSSGTCDFFIVTPHWLCVLVSMCVGVSVWLVGVVSVWQAELINCDIELVSYSSPSTRDIYLLKIMSRPPSEPTHSRTQKVPGSFSEVKWPWPKADQSSPSTVEVKNEWR